MHVQDGAAHLIAGGSKEKRSNRLLTIALDEFYLKINAIRSAVRAFTGFEQVTADFLQRLRVLVEDRNDCRGIAVSRSNKVRRAHGMSPSRFRNRATSKRTHETMAGRMKTCRRQAG
jgi:hypothetical protein